MNACLKLDLSNLLDIKLRLDGEHFCHVESQASLLLEKQLDIVFETQIQQAGVRLAILDRWPLLDAELCLLDSVRYLNDAVVWLM